MLHFIAYIFPDCTIIDSYSRFASSVLIPFPIIPANPLGPFQTSQSAMLFCNIVFLLLYTAERIHPCLSSRLVVIQQDDQINDLDLMKQFSILLAVLSVRSAVYIK